MRRLIEGVQAAIVVGGTIALATGAEAADAARGLRLFKTDGCFECHGTQGQGGPGARLAPKPLPAEAIAAYIRNPAGEMPPYNAKVVTDADVADIQAYLTTVPAPPSVASLDELKWR